jgi:tetratricopeptide (TPR) repeat protein
MRRALLIPSLVLLVFAAYWPVRQAEFVNFDDPIYITNNPEVFRGLSKQSFLWALTTFHASNWHPLTWLSHMLDCQFFSDHAGAHHLVNVSIHACNTCLLFLLLAMMTGAFWRPTWVAALFGLHPLHVESVAWISERKDVLSTFFAFLGLAAYLLYVRRKQSNPPPGRLLRLPASLFYCLAVFLFALGLLCKPMLVTFPFLLILLDYWPLGRFVPGQKGASFRLCLFRLVREKLPFLVLALAASIITLIAQSSGGSVSSLEKLPLDHRVANAVISYVTYLQKAFWPSGLCVFYPFTSQLPVLKAIACGTILLVITGIAVASRRRAPFFLMGWLWFLGTLAPVIGLVQVGGQAMADRYTYVPLIGIFIIIAWGAEYLLNPWRFRLAFIIPLAGYAILASLAATLFQVRYWHDSLALFQHALAVCPEGNSLAHHNLGHALALGGNQRQAIVHFNEALRLRPGYPQAHLNRGSSLAIQNRLEEAAADFRKAIQLQPNYDQAYYHLASVLALQLKLDEAKANFLLALHYKPDYAEAHTKLGNLLILQEITSQGLEHLQAAVRIEPDYQEGHYYLAGALARQKDFAGAAAHLRSAIKLKSDDPRPLNDLAWILAAENDRQLYDPQEAIRLATRACKLTQYRNPLYLDTLGVAFSEAGSFAEATQIAEQAVAIAAARGDDKAITIQLQKHSDLFRKHHSYSDRSRVE